MVPRLVAFTQKPTEWLILALMRVSDERHLLPGIPSNDCQNPKLPLHTRLSTPFI